jgi:transcriptional regulator with XRE-family HTH domain
MASTLKSRIAELSADRQRGWQARLAEHCGVSGPSVNAWVKGDTKQLDGEHLLRASEFFGVTPQWLQTGKGPKLLAASHGNTVVMEPPMVYAGTRRPQAAGLKPGPDYRTIVHTLCDALEQAGSQVTVRTFVTMADATYRKLSG